MVWSEFSAFKKICDQYANVAMQDHRIERAKSDMVGLALEGRFLTSVDKHLVRSVMNGPTIGPCRPFCKRHAINELAVLDNI